MAKRSDAIFDTIGDLSGDRLDKYAKCSSYPTARCNPRGLGSTQSPLPNRRRFHPFAGTIVSFTSCGWCWMETPWLEPSRPCPLHATYWRWEVSKNGWVRQSSCWREPLLFSRKWYHRRSERMAKHSDAIWQIECLSGGRLNKHAKCSSYPTTPSNAIGFQLIAIVMSWEVNYCSCITAV